MNDIGQIRDEELLTRNEAARFLRCSSSFLAHMAGNPDGPPLIKLGRRVLYDKSAILEWARAHTISFVRRVGRPRKR